jgi:hypothetical protein
MAWVAKIVAQVPLFGPAAFPGVKGGGEPFGLPREGREGPPLPRNAHMTLLKRKDSSTFKRENSLENQERIYQLVDFAAPPKEVSCACRNT